MQVYASWYVRTWSYLWLSIIISCHGKHSIEMWIALIDTSHQYICTSINTRTCQIVQLECGLFVSKRRGSLGFSMFFTSASFCNASPPYFQAKTSAAAGLASSRQLLAFEMIRARRHGRFPKPQRPTGMTLK